MINKTESNKGISIMDVNVSCEALEIVGFIKNIIEYKGTFYHIFCI